MTSYYQQHQKVLKQFRLDLQKELPDIRTFERHVGMFYTKNNIPIRINSPGMSDLWGIYPLEINGLKLPIHLELEIKTGNATQSKSQKHWQSFVESVNGEVFVVKHIDESIEKVKNYLNVFK